MEAFYPSGPGAPATALAPQQHGGWATRKRGQRGTAAAAEFVAALTHNHNPIMHDTALVADPTAVLMDMDLLTKWHEKWLKNPK